MKGRISQIMQTVQMKQNEFANALGISPSSLSSILNGHTSPTANTVQAIHRRFPEISITWLMFGEGDMYQDSPEGNDRVVNSRMGAGNQSDSDQTKMDGLLQFSGEAQEISPEQTAAELAQPNQVIIRETVKYIDKPQRKITEILVHYDDGTFESFPARKAE